MPDPDTRNVPKCADLYKGRECDACGTTHKQMSLLNWIECLDEADERIIDAVLAGISKEAREVVEAVVRGTEPYGASVAELPAPTGVKAYEVRWIRPPSKDKPCSTCGGSGLRAETKDDKVWCCTWQCLTCHGSGVTP